MSDGDKSKSEIQQSFGDQGNLIFPDEAKPPILAASVRSALHHWMYEINAAPALEAVGLKPRTRCFLSGPPGGGKTTLAHHVAARLGMPLLVVQAHSLVSPFVNQSGQQIARLFKTLRRQSDRVAVLFDEFDALAKNREGMSGQAADNERANITIALLQEIDRYDGLLFAATNVTKSIDAAIWRRFELQIEINYPGPEERFAIVKMYLAPYEPEDETVHAIAYAMQGASPALIKQACEAIKRGMVLGPRMGLDTDLRSLMNRFANSASAADAQEEPRLWCERRAVLVELSKAPWPPAMPEGKAA